MIYYFAHPVGTGEARWENMARAKRWFTYLLNKYPNDVFVASWVPYVQVLPDTPESHKRGMRDDLMVLKLCDGIVLCGGHLSEGMRKELIHCARTGYAYEVMDLLHLGAEPPTDG